MSDEIGINVATEERYLAYKDKIFGNAVGGNSYWSRYLDVFSWVRVIARVQQVDNLPEAAVPLTDKRISFGMIPNYQGPSELIRKLPFYGHKQKQSRWMTQLLTYVFLVWWAHFFIGICVRDNGLMLLRL